MRINKQLDQNKMHTATPIMPSYEGTTRRDQTFVQAPLGWSQLAHCFLSFETRHVMRRRQLSYPPSISHPITTKEATINHIFNLTNFQKIEIGQFSEPCWNCSSDLLVICTCHLKHGITGCQFRINSESANKFKSYHLDPNK